jgi:hypothetical protein
MVEMWNYKFILASEMAISNVAFVKYEFVY